MANWFTCHRVEWIGEMLRVFGFINRAHLQRRFGISKPQASMDLRTFQKMNPGYIRYDLSARSYVLVDSLPEVR